MELIEAIQKVKEKYRTGAERIADEKQVIARYGTVFKPENLGHLTAEDFKSFLLIKNNKHWEGIHRHGNKITSDMPKLKNALNILLDESKPIKERLNKLLPKNGPAYIKGLGRAVLTPILMVVYPDKYAVYNSVAETGMKGFGIFPQFTAESFAEKYVKINEIIIDLAKQNQLSLWQMDTVWWMGIHKEDAEIEKKEEAEAGVYSSEIEAQLEDLIIGKWEKISEFKDLEILQEDGEDIGQQYDTKEVGRIDLLCKNKKTGDYVVIELKRGRESDKVIGQVLRYIGWVNKNLAKDNPNTKGLIITYEDDPRLRYALEPIKDLVQLKFYKISISIC